MTQYYSATTGEFFDSQAHQTLPDDAVEITTPMLALLTAIARKAQIGDPNTILATRKYVDDAVQKSEDKIEQTVKEKYSGLRNMQVFDKDGEFTVPENCTRIKIRLWGGGGGGAVGGSWFSSGAGGGYAEGFFTVIPGQTLDVIVGAAGSRGIEGEKGGTSKVSSFISATGGEGGRNTRELTEKVLGGVGQGGDWQVTGSLAQIICNGVGGTGGAAFGSSGGLGNFKEGFPGMTPGGGGAGGGLSLTNESFNGGTGGAGLVIIEY